ncbi:MAG: hypothetical protein K9J27_12940 [Bacteroidales bacterium]|nr:hypothetical protein [Bacteroidales bacterium]
MGQTYKHSERYITVFLMTVFLLLFGGKLLKAGQPKDTIKEDTLKEQAPNVYLDCWFCDKDHIKREIHYLNYVRDRKDADVHVMIASERTASGGRRYTVYMLGQQEYGHLQDTLRFNVGPEASEEDRRRKMVHTLKTGLTPYIIKTPLWENLQVEYSKPTEPQKTKDKWNYWVFELSANGRMNGEESRNSYNLRGNIEANKITKDIKLEFGAGGSYSKSIYEVNSKTITSIHRNYNLQGLAVKSLSQHWSAGGSAALLSSRYMNIKMLASVAPGIEFNVFPYSESTTRQLTFLYRPEFMSSVYEDTTIFNKIRESRIRERLSVDYKIKKEWGSVNFSLNASHYFHDFSKNRLSFNSSVSLNLVRGLNVFFNAGASLIHDQLSLPKGEATSEEILTRQQQLATDYNYHASFGISYTFGSRYNNIVNPRF